MVLKQRNKIHVAYPGTNSSRNLATWPQNVRLKRDMHALAREVLPPALGSANEEVKREESAMITAFVVVAIVATITEWVFKIAAGVGIVGVVIGFALGTLAKLA